MTSEYLLKEYELCFGQLRFYDTRHQELMRYLFTLTSAVVTAEFALLEYLKAPSSIFYMGIGVLSFVVFVASVLLYTCMLQNRVYFVFVARQINAIRGYLMNKEASDFKDNQMYTRFDFNAFRFWSLHTMYLFGTAFISSILAGATSYGFCVSLNLTSHVIVSIAAICIVGTVELVFGILYLSTAGRKHANEFLGKKGRPEN